MGRPSFGIEAGKLYLVLPFAGARTLRDLLRSEGVEVGRKRMITLMLSRVRVGPNCVRNSALFVDHRIYCRLNSRRLIRWFLEILYPTSHQVGHRRKKRPRV